jgi:hypothetical protein
MSGRFKAKGDKRGNSVAAGQPREGGARGMRSQPPVLLLRYLCLLWSMSRRSTRAGFGRGGQRHTPTNRQAGQTSPPGLTTHALALNSI